MKMKEAVQIVKDELGEKAQDKRTKVAKAVQYLEDRAKWDEAKLEQIIDETIAEFESKENDYIEAEVLNDGKGIPATSKKD